MSISEHRSREELLKEVRNLRSKLAMADRCCKICDASPGNSEDTSGKEPGKLTIERDAWQALLESKSRLEAILDSITDGVIFADTSRRAISVNSGAVKLFGYTPNELLGRTLDFLYADRADFEEMGRAHYSTQTTDAQQVFEAKYRRKDGSVFDAESLGAAVRDPSGKIIGYVGIHRDVSGRKAVAERLNEVASIPDENPNPVLRVTAEGALRYHNRASPSLMQCLGIEGGGRISAHWVKVLREVLASGQVRELELDCRDTVFSVMFYPDPDGRYVNIYGRDITKRKRVENELKKMRDDLELRVENRTAELLREREQLLLSQQAYAESEARYRAMGELLPYGVWITDADGKIIYLSKSFLDMVGFDLEEAKRVGWLSKLHQEDVERVAADWERCLKGCSYLDHEFRIIGKDGAYRAILSRGVAVRDSRGRVISWSGLNIDITERKKNEEAMKNQASLLDMAHDAILVRDLEGRILYWNRGAMETYGFRSDEALGEVSHNLLHTRFEESREAVEARVLTEGQWQGILYHKKKDGTPIVTASRWALQKNEFGKSIGFLEINRDDTRRKEADDALKSYAAKLELLNRELQEFAFAAAHDLQEPLRKIQAFGSRLERRSSAQLDERGREFLSRMIVSANRMSEHLRSLLTYSRVSTEAGPIVLVNLSAVAKAALRDLRILSQQVTSQVQIGDLPAAEVDVGQMHQLFVILLTNAVKYQRPGVEPLIRVHGEVTGESCRIYFEDNGIGFEEKYVDRIFRPFQRLHGRSEYEGTGMGLAICRKIVERHGGSITARSKPGEGATFIVTIPLEQHHG